MRTIGLIGGISWYSTIDYYRSINEGVNKRLGGNASAEMILYSVNYETIKSLTEKGQWEAIASIITEAAQKLELAGAQCLMLGANTMHHIAGQVQSAIGIPIIHIATETAKEIRRSNLNTVALLGTKYTMQMPFYRKELEAAGIRVLIPEEGDIAWINDSIYNEMGRGIFSEATKKRYLLLIEALRKNGAEGIVLGCTEIPLLITEGDTQAPLFNTTAIHARAAVNFALHKEAIHM